MNTLQRSLCFVAMAASFFLAACGGGGSDSATTGTTTTGTPTTQSPPATPTGVDFAAIGSSASTVSLGWTRPAGSATYAIERKSAGGDWVAVASVDARSGTYLDSGLAALTDYSYRLVEVGASRTTLAEKSTRTSDAQPVTTAAGSALAQAVTTTLGAAGGTLASPDGTIVVHVPAGAFAADTHATAQPVTNTAPDGRGDGLKIRIDAAPTAPLTLTLRYDAAHDDEADGQRIAVQRADGSWISLPLLAIDKTARTLTSELPAQLFAAPAGAGAAAAEKTARALSADSVRPLAAVPAAVSPVEVTVSGYLAFYLLPRHAVIEVKKSFGLVPHAHIGGDTLERCWPDDPDGCITVPLTPEREMQFLNNKPGFDRGWYVSGVQGGNATVGTVSPSGDIGAMFKAPNKKPDPSTVTVSFRSRHQATGRSVTLSARVEIYEDRWVGTMNAVNGPSDVGTTLSAIAHVAWEVDAAASTEDRKVYRPTGTVEVSVTDNDCNVAITPASQPVATDVRLVELVVDESGSERTYTARLITFWPATLVCPRATQQAFVGYGWEVSGVVNPDGRRIEGKGTDESGAKIEWSFTR